MKKFIIFVLLVVVLALVVIASPYYKLHTLKVAYDQGDYQPIVHSIDFERLRANLKEQLHPKVKTAINDSRILGSFQVLGVNSAALDGLTNGLVDRAIDGAITKDNAQQLMQGELSANSWQLLILLALAVGLVDGDKLVQDYLMTGDIHQAISVQKHTIKQLGNQLGGEPVLGYCGMNCFEIQTAMMGEPVTIVMSRRALWDWQIDNVLLP